MPPEEGVYPENLLFYLLYYIKQPSIFFLYLPSLVLDILYSGGFVFHK